MNNQYDWHRKSKDWKVCPECGCENIREGVLHRALKADETWEWKAQYVKKIKVSFGQDTSIEPVRAK